MTVVLVVLSLAGAAYAGLGLVLTRIGLRRLAPARGAVASLSTAALLFLALSPPPLPGAGWHHDAAGFPIRAPATGIALGGEPPPAQPPGPATLPSRLHHEVGDNYFTNAEGKEVYLAGFHNWMNIQDRNGVPFDNPAFLALQRASGGNIVRLWQTDNGNDHGGMGPKPYMQDAQGRFDLHRLNPAYFARLRSRVEGAGEAGLYASVMMFNAWGWHQAESSAHSPYSAGNNVNGISAGHHEVMSLRNPQIVAVQEAFVRKVAETVGDLPHVLYEVANEANNDPDGWAWQRHILDVIRQVDQDRHLAGITAAEWWSGDRHAIGGELAASAASWTSPDGADYMDGSVPEATGAKVSIVDTDHLWGTGGMSTGFVWEVFTRGHNYWQMDTLGGKGIRGASEFHEHEGKQGAEDAGREGIRQTMLAAKMVDLNGVRDRGDLSSTGFALADPADGEFIVYAPSGGAFAVDLSGAAERVLGARWINVSDGAVVDAPSVAGGGASRSFTAPFAGAAALILTDADAPPPSGAASAPPATRPSTTRP